MKDLMKLSRKQALKHLVIWLVVFFFLNAIGSFTGNWFVLLFGGALSFINYMFVFYGISFYVFPKYWLGNRFLLVINILSILLIYWFSCYAVNLYLIPAIGGQTYYQQESLIYFLKNTFYFFVITASVGAISFFNRFGLYKFKHQLEREKLLLIKDLNYFKSNFNYYTTTSFLDYCYKTVKDQSEETADSITLFRNMLKYTIETKPTEKVELISEINYIQNFIELQKLLSAKVYVNFMYNGDLDDKQILPRILITFVENAFKHGIYNDSNCPIEINLECSERMLYLTVKNKVNIHKSKVKSTHTGLDNVTHLLELNYPFNYSLNTNEKDGFFEIALTIDFDNSSCQNLN